jgi:hypothetical protein
LVEPFTAEVLGEVSEDEGGPVGVLHGLARRSVQGFVQDTGLDSVGVGALEVLELGAQGQSCGVGEELVSGHLAEWVSGNAKPELAERFVEVEFSVLPEGPDGGPDSEDLGEARDVEHGVWAHGLVGAYRVEEAGGAAVDDAGSVAHGPYGTGIDVAVHSGGHQLAESFGRGGHRFLYFSDGPSW